ncbi:MAG: ribonuclease P protein component [Balneolaceae bacterium]|nr:ribonuclease P protein component [Balneolaceae bacterium]
MRKDRNSQDSQKPDFSLPRSKILRGRRNFQRLFEKSTVLNSNSLQFRYRIYQNPDEGCFIGFIAPKKKIRGAVKRNRVKRLLREVYRTHQFYLQELFSGKTFGLHGVFIANRPDVTFAEIREEMVPMLENLRGRLQRLENKLPVKEKPETPAPNSEY